MTQNHVYRIQRGRILKILYRAFPEAVHKTVISLTLSQMGLTETDGVIRGHCDYLAGKGYVVIQEKQDDVPDYKVKLTPKGIDLIEENISKDPGIEF